MQNDIIRFVNEAYNRILKSYNIFQSALYTILLRLKSYVMTLFNDSKLLCWRFNMILNSKYNYKKMTNPQSRIFWKSNFHWTYVIKNCRKLNAKMIAVFFLCVVRADAHVAT